MKNQIIQSRRRETLRISIREVIPKLITLKKEEDREAFNKLFMQVIPEIKEYVISRIRTAIKKNHFPKNMYSANDFIDQLFIETYDNIDQFSNEDEFYVWLYKKTNELLDDVITEEEFDELFFKNIDEYSQPEWDQLEEKFTAESDGDLIMKEDLEDISYYREPYNVKDVFVTDTERALTEQIDERLHKEEIDRHIELVLHNLSKPMRTVFQLYTKKHLTLAEIATIQEKSIERVQELLQDARDALKISLFNRYTLSK